uniref:Sulfate_transp domain-containing protein n=1 Tax=Steinernema glaseri TaxID=37863 RepID=A0A1I7Z3K7_9BILA
MDKKSTKLPTEKEPLNVEDAPRKKKPPTRILRFLKTCCDAAEATQITDDSMFFSAPRLGSFWGVFVPRIQNLLCFSFLILRLPWMVGVLGLLPCILVIVNASILVLPTTFSVVALCSSGHERLSGGPFSILSYSVGDTVALSSRLINTSARQYFVLAVALLFACANAVLAAVHVNLAVEVFVNSIALPYSLSLEDNNVWKNIFRAVSDNYWICVYSICVIVFLLVVLNKKIFQFLAFLPTISITVAVLLIYTGIVYNLITGQLQVQGCATGNVLHPRSLFEPKTVGPNRCICHPSANRYPNIGNFTTANSRNASFTDDPRFPRCYTVKTDFRCHNATSNLRALSFLSKSWTTGEKSALIDEDEFPTLVRFLALVITALSGHVFNVNISPKVANPRKRVVCSTVAAKIYAITVFFVNSLVYGVFVDSILLSDRYGITRDHQMTASLIAVGSPHVINGLMILTSVFAAAQCARAQKTIVREVLKCRLFDGMGLLHSIFTSCKKTAAKVPMSRELIKKYVRIRDGLLSLVETIGFITLCLITDADSLIIIAAQLFLQAAVVINLISGMLHAFGNNAWHPSFPLFNSKLAIFIGFFCLAVSCCLHFTIAICHFCVFLVLTVVVFVKPDPVTSLGFVDFMMYVADAMLSSSIGKVARPGKGRFHHRIVIFSHTPEIPDALIRAGKALEQGSGCPSLVMTLIREPPCTPGEKRMQMGKFEVACSKMGMNVNDLPGHAMILYYQKISSLDSVIMAAYNNAGMGMFKLDTVIMNYPTKTIIAATAIPFYYHSSMHRAMRRNGNVIVMKGSFLMRSLETIDVWWILDAGDLLFCLAKQLSQYEKMIESSNKKAKVRLYVVVPDQLSLASMVEKKLIEWMVQNRAVFHSVEVVKVQICLIWMYVSKLKEQIEFRISQAVGTTQKGERFLGRHLKKKYPVQSIIDLSFRMQSNAENLFSRAGLESAVGGVDKDNCMTILNREILNRSKKADLVVLNMPDPPVDLAPFEEYLHFVDAQIQGLDNVLLVHSCDAL